MYTEVPESVATQKGVETLAASLELPVLKARQYVLPLTVDVKDDVDLKYLPSARTHKFTTLVCLPAEVEHRL